MNEARILFHLIFKAIVVLVLSISSLFAQDLMIENAAAVIEYDSIMISISGKKSSLMKIYFTRSFKVKIKSEEGVLAFNNFSIPESFDPLLFCHSPKDRNMGKHLASVIIEKYNVKIEKTDGQVFNPEIDPQFESYNSVDLMEDKFGNYDRYIFNIESLSKGDILEIQYTYSAPYAENIFNVLTFRTFFHGEFPVLSKDFVFIKEKSLEAEINSNFCDDPIVEHEKKTTYSWHFNNLAGCMSEPGIRPYKSLPHVIISLRPYEMIYTLPSSFEERFIPFYAFGPAFRESRHLTIVRAMYDGVNSKQYIQIRRFIETRLENIPDDTSGYSQLYEIHNHIAENFEFDPDLEYFDRLDVRDERLGDYLTAGVIRDRSRYNIYVGLIAGLDLNYFTGYLADIRTGVISESYFEPTISNDYLLIALLKTGSVQFIYPKKEKFGYYLNELPFYFENTKVRLIYLDDFRYIKSPIQEKFVSTQTPSSNSTDNTRKQSASVSVDVENLTIDFNASISLSGQFSTLGRGSYLYNSCDPTVNPLYCKKFWESISPGTEPDTRNIQSVERDYPFRTMISTSFHNEKALQYANDTLSLDLSGWFPHIIDYNLKSGQRVLHYYPDFKNTDSFTYQVTFNKKVKVIDRLPDVQIKNTYGDLILKCVQKLDGTILLSSRLVVNAEKVQPERIMDVYVIQEHLKNLNEMKIRLVLSE